MKPRLQQVRSRFTVLVWGSGGSGFSFGLQRVSIFWEPGMPVWDPNYRIGSSELRWILL